MGGLSSFCRSLYGELIPPGFEAAFYALYAITDKGSSVFGPAIVGAITDAYGEIRPVSRSNNPPSLLPPKRKGLQVIGILVPCSPHRAPFPAHDARRC
jgi:hypothetical protein